MKVNSTHLNSYSRHTTLSRVATTSSGLVYYPKLIAVLILITFTSLVVRVYFSNELAVSGARVSFAVSQAEELAAKNYNLENEISSKAALNYIEAKATELGLVKINKVQVIKAVPSVALK